MDEVEAGFVRRLRERPGDARRGPDESVRFCHACRQNVHWARDLEQAYALAAAGRCVVVDLVQLRRPGDLSDLGPARRPPGGGAMMPPMELVLDEGPGTKVSLAQRVRRFFRR
jgi:hypothetical protein